MRLHLSYHLFPIFQNFYDCPSECISLSIKLKLLQWARRSYTNCPSLPCMDSPAAVPSGAHVTGSSRAGGQLSQSLLSMFQARPKILHSLKLSGPKFSKIASKFSKIFFRSWCKCHHYSEKVSEVPVILNTSVTIAPLLFFLSIFSDEISSSLETLNLGIFI